ncbi:IucA/IucC family protein [Streptomyces sp. MS06]|uniref:IucA/IucC family protein n=1 Tax=Streptomyces sp. MS06 TaxID=3385974 RepID=UPI0039A25B11
MHRPPTAEAEVAAELAVLRPDLVPRYEAALPGARAAVLTRLWRALTHEPLPWVAGRSGGPDGVTLRLADGRRLHGPAPDPYATGAYVTQIRLDGVRHDRPERLMAGLGVPQGAGFAAELGHSAASMALSRAGRPDGAGAPPPDRATAPLPDRAGTGLSNQAGTGLWDPAGTRVSDSAGAGPPDPAQSWPENGWEWEQRVVDGHPYHPACRARPGFSVAEQLAYGPEHRPVVELVLLPVEERECLVSGGWPDELRETGRLLVPVHPWQAEHVLGRAGGDRLSAHPLMSLRTLAVPGGPHVKTALSARLTSSVRDISTGSVRMSAALSAFGQVVSERTGGLLQVTRTLGAVTAHSPDLAALVREPPQRYAGRGEHVVPVAALAATGLPGSPGWLGGFARLALTVGLRLLELGVALEAHGQNLLVVLGPSGTPRRLVYRDLGDIRVSPSRLARHGIALPELSLRILTDDVAALRRKLFGSLVGGALAAAAGSGPVLRAALAEVAGDLPPGPDLASLRGEPLPVKALTLMRLSPGRRGDLWTALPSPFLPPRAAPVDGRPCAVPGN